MFSILANEDRNPIRHIYDSSLQVGDGLAWRGERLNKPGSGEGDYFVVVTYG